MTDVVISSILAAYPFGRLAVVGAFDASFRNENWLVAGERSRRNVLWRHLQHVHVPRTAFQVRREVGVMRALRAEMARSGPILSHA
jgi:hypothetical protein